MKKIYIVLTYTGTILSKIIKGYTRAEYCHVSLALDENLSDYIKLSELQAELEELQTELSIAMNEWETLSEELEELGS